MFSVYLVRISRWLFSLQLFTTLTDLLTTCTLFWDVTVHFREGTLSHTRTSS